MSEPDERWLRQYGLDRDPFPEAETPVDFFSRGGREKQMELLADMASLGRPLVAVIGESGVGKSTFFHNLLRRLPEQARVARVTAGVFLSSKALLQAIARAMGVEADPDEPLDGLRGRLHASIRERARAGTPCVIMVDDAGELEGDALAELLSLSELGLGEQPVRVILFAMPGVRDALVRATDASRVDGLVHEMMLDRYSLNELRGYLQFRLARAGLQGASPFAEEDYQEIFRRSGGLPGRANAIAGGMLREPPASGLGTVPMRWLAGGVCAALLLGAVLLLLFSNEDGGQEAGVETGPADPVRLASSEEIPEEAGEPEAPTTGVEPSATAPTDDAGEWLPVASAPDAVGETPAAPGNAADTAEPQPVSPPATDDGTRSDAAVQLLALDPEHFVLQLLVNSSASRARDWIAARDDPDQYRWFRRERDGVPQYVVVRGAWPSRAEASRVADAVAERTGVDAPWIRRVADIQAEIRSP
jgi:type II secretory pathway predicted ATPase ExeA